MMSRVRSRLRLPQLVLAGVLLAAAGAAEAAPAATTLTTDARCYAQGAPLQLTAGGLTPRAPLTVALDGQALRYRDGSLPVADAAGTFTSSFSTPALAPGARQQPHRLTVGDGTKLGRARFTVTRPAGAEFAPARGDPRTLRARFSVWGFALDGDPHPRAWLHWIDPRGKVRASAALGMTQGDCGTLTTPPRRVFPFEPEPGHWTLAIDTSRRYRVHEDGPRAKIPVHIRSLAP